MGFPMSGMNSGSRGSNPFTRPSGSQAAEANARIGARLEWLSSEIPELTDPNVAYQLASSTMSDAELYEAAAGAVEGAEWRQQLDYLNQASPARQRAMWDMMHPSRQKRYQDLGYQPPTAEQIAGKSDSWMAPVSNALGTGFNFVKDQIGTGFGWMENAVDTVAERPQRTIDRMNGDEQMANQLGLKLREARMMLEEQGIELSPDQWIKMYWTYAERNRHTFKSLGGTSTLPGPLGTAANMLHPEPGVTHEAYGAGNPFKPVGGVSVDENLYRQFEGIAEQLSSKPEYQSGFTASWGEVADGYQYISPAQQIEIQNRLNHVPDMTFHLAMWMGQGKTAEDWVKERENLDPASAEGMARIQQIETDAWSTDGFGEAVEMASKYAGSTTAGRSFANALGMEDTGAGFTAVSGMTDALFQMTLDPTLAGGKALRGYKGAKWAVRAGDGGEFLADVSRSQRWWQMSRKGAMHAQGPVRWTPEAARVSRGTRVGEIIGEAGVERFGGKVDDLFDEMGRPTKFLEENYDDLDHLIRDRIDDSMREAFKPNVVGEEANRLLDEAKDAVILRDTLRDTVMPLEKRKGMAGAVDRMRRRAAVVQGDTADMIAKSVRASIDGDANAIPDLLQKMPHLTDGIQGIIQWDTLLKSWRGHGIQDADDIFDFYRSHLGAMGLINGRLTPTYLSGNLVELPRFTARNKAGRGAVKVWSKTFDWMREAGADGGFVKRTLTKPVRGTGALVTGLTHQVPRSTGLTLMDDGSYWLDMSSTSAVGEFIRLTDFGKFMGINNMDTATRNRYITDFILGDLGEGAAANMATRRTVMKNYLRDMFDAAGVQHAKNPEVKRWADNLIEQFDGQAYGPPGIDDLPVGDMTRRSPIFPDSQFSPIVEIPAFREVAAATRKTSSLTAFSMRHVNNPLIDAMMGQVWKPSMLLRAGFIPRAAGEEALATIVRHGANAVEAKLVAMGVSEHGTLIGTLMGLPGDLIAKGFGELPNDMYKFREAMRYRSLVEDTMRNGTSRVRNRKYWEKLAKRMSDDASDRAYEAAVAAAKAEGKSAADVAFRQVEPNWADKFGMVSDWFAGTVSARMKTGYFRLGSSDMQQAGLLLAEGGVKHHSGREQSVARSMNLQQWVDRQDEIANTTKRMLRSVHGVDRALAEVSAHQHFLYESVDEAPHVTSVIKGYSRGHSPVDLQLATGGGYYDIDVDDALGEVANEATVQSLEFVRDSFPGQAAARSYAGLIAPDKAQEYGLLLDLDPGVPIDQVPGFLDEALGGPLTRRTDTGQLLFDRAAIGADWDAGTSLVAGPEAKALTEMGIDPQRLVEKLGSDRRYERFLRTREEIAYRRGYLPIKPGMEQEADALLQNQRVTRQALDEMKIKWEDVAAEKPTPARLDEINVEERTVFEPKPPAAEPYRVPQEERKSGWEPTETWNGEPSTYALERVKWEHGVKDFVGDMPTKPGISKGPMRPGQTVDPDTGETIEQTLQTWTLSDEEGIIGFLTVDYNAPKVVWIRKDPDVGGPVGRLLEEAARKDLGDFYAQVQAGSEFTQKGWQFGLRNQARGKMVGRDVGQVEHVRGVLSRPIDDLADSEIDDVLQAMGRTPREGELARDVYGQRSEHWLAGLSDDSALDEAGAVRSTSRILNSDLYHLSKDELDQVADAYGVARGDRTRMLQELHEKRGEAPGLIDPWVEPDDPSKLFTSPLRVQAHMEAIRQRIARYPKPVRASMRRVIENARSSPVGKGAYSRAAIEAARARPPAGTGETLLRYLDSTHAGSDLEHLAFKHLPGADEYVWADQQLLDDLDTLLRFVGTDRSAAHVLVGDSPIRIGRPADVREEARKTTRHALGNERMEPYTRNQERYNFVDGQPVVNPLPEYMRSYYAVTMDVDVIDQLAAMAEQNTDTLLRQLGEAGLSGDDMAVVASMLDEIDPGVQGAFRRSAAKDRRYAPLTHFAFGNYDDAERITGILNQWYRNTTKQTRNVAEVGYNHLPDTRMWPSPDSARQALMPADELPLSVYRTEEWVASGMRPYTSASRTRFNAAGEIDEAGEHVLEGGTYEDALDAGVDPILAYIDEMFVRNGEVVHELLEPVLNGTLSKQTPRYVNRDRLPKHVVGRTELTVDPGWWQKAIRKGFDGYIAPAVSAMVRNPMLVMNMAEGLKGAQLVDDLMRSGRLMKEGMKPLKRIGYDIEQVRDLWWGIDDATREAIEDGKSFRKALAPFDSRDHDDWSKWLTDLTDDELGQVARMMRHDEYVENAVVHTALGRAVRDTIPYIDDHNVRSFFQEYARNLMPFQFAQEQFLKRWARTFAYDPAAAERLRLLTSGFTQSVLVHENDRGEKAFYIPMSEQLGQIMAKVPLVNALWGTAAEVPLSVPLSGEVNSMLPGIPGDFEKLPSLGPIAAIPTQALRSHFPEFRPFFDTMLGSETDRSLVSQLMPSWLSRSIGAATGGGLGFEQELNGSMIGALQQMKAEADRLRMAATDADEEGRHDEATEMRQRANELDLPDTATPYEVEAFLDETKEWARANMATRALVGFFSPAPAKTDFADAKLAPEFTALLEHHPIEEALALFLTQHPEGGAYAVFATEKPSGAPLPAVNEAGEWMTTNRDWMEQFPLAAPWMLPQMREGDDFDRHAYNDMLAIEMRRRKAPEEWYADLKFAAAARTYFTEKDRYMANRLQMEMAGNTEGMKMADMIWKQFSTSYRNQHPLFAQQLTGEARTSRLQALDELRTAMNDPARPSFAHEERTQELLDAFDEFEEAQRPYKSDSREEARMIRERMKQMFSDWGEQWIRENPEMTTMWRTLIEPAAGLRDDRVARNLVLQQTRNGAAA